LDIPSGPQEVEVPQPDVGYDESPGVGGVVAFPFDPPSGKLVWTSSKFDVTGIINLQFPSDILRSSGVGIAGFLSPELYITIIVPIGIQDQNGSTP